MAVDNVDYILVTPTWFRIDFHHLHEEVLNFVERPLELIEQDGTPFVVNTLYVHEE